MLKKIAIILFVALWTTVALQGQETVPEKPAGTLVPDKAPVEKVPVEKPVEAVKKKPAKKEAVKALVKPVAKKAEKKKEVKANVPAEKTDGAEGALLRINEGNFKYKRIPEIVLEEPQKGEKDDFVHIPDENLEANEKNEADSDKGGIFNLDRRKSDMVAWGGLLFLLIAIFLIYRARSRGGRSVHRSFPK